MHSIHLYVMTSTFFVSSQPLRLYMILNVYFGAFLHLIENESDFERASRQTIIFICHFFFVFYSLVLKMSTKKIEVNSEMNLSWTMQFSKTLPNGLAHHTSFQINRYVFVESHVYSHIRHVTNQNRFLDVSLMCIFHCCCCYDYSCIYVKKRISFFYFFLFFTYYN